MNLLRLDPTRRDLLIAAGAGALHGLAAGVLGSRSAWAATPAKRKIVFDEPWGEVVELADRVWAVVSTPLESSDWKTLSSGGIIAGDERVLAIEAFLRNEGAAWVGERAVDLTGRWPTDVVVTHYHGDHAGGLAGYASGDHRPRVWMTRATLDLVRRDDAERETEDPVRSAMLDDVEILDPDDPTELDLGGRTAVVHPRRGHTASDLSIEIEEPSLVFCGDLVWNRLFPNYRDTLPSDLSRSVRAMRRERETLYIPGHGPLAGDGEYQMFVDLIDSLEAAARDAVEKGIPLADAAAAYRLPEPVADWHLFQETYFETALGAWFRELGA